MVAVVLGTAGAGYVWLNQPFDLPTPTVDLSIEPGTNARDVAVAVADAGVPVRPALLYWWFRLSGQSRQIKAGSYELDRATTPRSLLRKLVRGEESLRSITLVEGWTFRQVRDALRKAEQLKPASQDLTADALMAQLGRPGVAPEGRFFPDTYTYSKGSSDLAVLQRALRAMDKKLEAAWAQRDPGSPLQTPEQALILASIVEKETGAPGDRPQIAAVFSNRLRIGMRLQTDPTVIYGMGEAFDGNLRKVDLQTDTPWNTYTRTGLPPTPIAMPGKASLLAAVQPAPSKALYFVAKGDGSSHFSATLDEHNRAVNKYQRGQ
ncbi:MAG: endolytic transglycosylase MltG [Rhodoferax sp.]